MLVFRKYGDRHFLAQVWTGSSTGRTLHLSRAEKEIARNGVRAEWAYVTLGRASALRAD